MKTGNFRLTSKTETQLQDHKQMWTPNNTVVDRRDFPDIECILNRIKQRLDHVQFKLSVTSLRIYSMSRKGFAL